MKNVLFIMILMILMSCSRDNNQTELRFIGKLSVEGLSNTYVNIYQEDENFEDITGLDFEIVGNGDKIILGRRLLIGTHDYVMNLDGFTVKSRDSIMYITYVDKNKILALYDLKTGFHSSLTKRSDNWNKETENEMIQILQFDNKDLKKI